MSKVIDFKPEKGFTFNRKSKPEQQLCNHPSVVVDEETRTIECSKCEIVLDPFEYLRRVCYDENAAFERYVMLQKEVAKLEKKYYQLKKDIGK